MSSRDVQPEKRTTTAPPLRLNEIAVERYAEWRDACVAVDEAYHAWSHASASEGPGGFVVAGDRGQIDHLVREGLAISVGEAGGEAIEIACGDASISVALADAGAAWNSLGERMDPVVDFPAGT